MNDRFGDVRAEVCEYARRMADAGLVVASAGNVSARVPRHDGLIAITPTSVPYDVMTAEQIVIVDLATGRSIESTYAPSYELPMHLVIYRERPDISAIVHTHAPAVTTLSVLHRPLPPVIDEMMLYFGGTIEVAYYSFTGTEQLGRNVVQALGDRRGVILSNHGNVCVGPTLERALHVAIVMESAARVYVQALSIGQPWPLPEEAIRAGRDLFDERNRKK